MSQGILTDLTGFKQMELNEINTLKQTTQEYIEIKSDSEIQAKEIACSTKIQNSQLSFPISGQVGNKHIQINDTFDQLFRKTNSWRINQYYSGQ